MSPDPWPRRPLFRLPFRRLHADDVDEELRFHLQGRIDELMAQGLSRERAEAEALRRFGDPIRIARELHAVDRSAERRRTLRDWIGTLSWELKLASRALTRRPGFLLVTVLTLALAIGANTVVFSALRGVVLQPLAVAEPERLVVLQQDAPALPLYGANLAVPEVLDLNRETGLFRAAAGWTPRSFNLTGTGDPNRIQGIATVGPFFEVFQLQPALGRLYSAQDSEGGNGRVALLSQAFWRGTFGARPDVLGQSVELNGVSYEIIGVLPASPGLLRNVQIFVPYQIQVRDRQPEGRGIWAVTAVGRLQDGIPRATLGTRLREVSRQWHERYGGYDPASGHVLVGQPMERWLGGELRGFLLALQAAVVFLLLIACANVGNLQLVRATERERELAVRSALGARGGSLVRQLLLESGLLAVGGGLLGIGLAQAVIALLRGLDAPELGSLASLRVDGAVLAYSGFVMVAATGLFGLVPAWRIRRPDLHNLMRSGAPGSTGGKQLVLKAGAVVQVALSLILVLGAAALVRSLGQLLRIDPGFEPERVATFRLALPASSYPEGSGRVAAFDAIGERLQAGPGVTQVGFINFVPFGPDRDSSPFRIVGRAPDPSGAVMHADMRFVHNEYFQAMGIPLRRGRLFERSDVRNSPWVAIIDQQLADEFFPGEDPVGRTINQGPDAIIVGVVGSIKHGTLQEEDKATVYYSYRQMSWVPSLTAVVRSSGPPLTATALQAEVSAVDPRLPVFDVRSMEDRIEGTLGPRRAGTLVLTGFGVIALSLALLGVYGVLSYSISRRTRELGIRLALGAQAGSLVGASIAGGLALGAVGLGLGLAGFAGLSRWLGSLMYGVRVFDALTLVSGLIVLGLGIALASAIPARRVVRVNPTEALRRE